MLKPNEVHEVGTPNTSNVRIPDTVLDGTARVLYSHIVLLRRQIKDVANEVGDNRQRAAAPALDREVGANVTLAFRALEDASMRLGKALQALDGGVSVYDRSEVPGA